MEKKDTHQRLPAGGPIRPLPPVVPIRAYDLSRPEIEAAILQVLALGRAASVDEAALTAAFGSVREDPTVTQWAQAFATIYGIRWERRRLFEDLLFSLIDAF